MGHVRHHAIIVTTTDEGDCQSCHEKAVALFGEQVSAVNEAQVNAFYSFIIFPDGSNEGWEDSDQGDRDRAAFKKWLKSIDINDQNGLVDWVEVQYGDDKRETIIVEDSDHPAKADIVDAVIMLPD